MSVKILFITNNCQLSGIVEHHYGGKISGYEYLDKIFDLIIEIPGVSIKNYVDAYSDIGEHDIREIVVSVAKYYGMSLRETERLILLFKTSMQYFKAGTFYVTSCGFNPYAYFAKHVLVPFILGAKVKNIDDFVALVGWGNDGIDIVKKIYNESSYTKDIVKRCNSLANMALRAESLYSQLASQDDSPGVEIKKMIADMVSLTGVLSDNISL